MIDEMIGICFFSDRAMLGKMVTKFKKFLEIMPCVDLLCYKSG